MVVGGVSSGAGGHQRHAIDRLSTHLAHLHRRSKQGLRGGEGAEGTRREFAVTEGVVTSSLPKSRGGSVSGSKEDQTPTDRTLKQQPQQQHIIGKTSMCQVFFFFYHRPPRPRHDPSRRVTTLSLALSLSPSLGPGAFFSRSTPPPLRPPQP